MNPVRNRASVPQDTPSARKFYLQRRPSSQTSWGRFPSTHLPAINLSPAPQQSTGDDYFSFAPVREEQIELQSTVIFNPDEEAVNERPRLSLCVWATVATCALAVPAALTYWLVKKINNSP